MPELDNKIEQLPKEGEWWLPENAQARLRMELGRRGLDASGTWIDILNDSHERGRKRVIARHGFPPDSTWLEIHHLLIDIGVSYPP